MQWCVQLATTPHRKPMPIAAGLSSTSLTIVPFVYAKHAGRKFAMTSLKTALSWLLRNYELEFTAGKMPADDYTTMVVAPTAPVEITYKRRK